MPRRRSLRRPWPAAFTLLEVVLALALSVLVIGTIAMAINLHLRVIDTGWGETARNQLARAVLNRMAEDLRAAVRYEKFDDSGLAAATGTIQAVNEAAGALAGSGGGASSRSGSGGAGSQTTSSGSVTSAEDQQLQTPGLYGDASQLNVDISRLPRADELAAGRQPSDMQTVRYYLASGADREQGLLRAASERATSVYAYQSGNARGLAGAPQPLAPEVTAIEFQYFDGVQWATSWDSVERGGLPMAVGIAIAVSDPGEKAGGAGTSLFVSSRDYDKERVYRLLVRLPAAEPTDEETTTAKSNKAQQKSTASASSQAGGSSGASGTGSRTGGGTSAPSGGTGAPSGGGQSRTGGGR